MTVNFGLTHAEARARIADEGFYELPRTRRRSSLRIVFDFLREPMLAMLIGGRVVYLPSVFRHRAKL